MPIIFFTLIILFICLAVYMLFIEPFRIRVIKTNVITKKWTGDQSLKIALISDVHAVWPWMSVKHIERIVTKVNEQKPDIVLLLGDYVATHPFGILPNPDMSIAPYTKLDAPCGIFAVLGNHDFNHDQRWIKALKDAGIPVLENSAVKVTCKKRDFWVAGLEEFNNKNPDVEKTLESVTDEAPVVLAMHNPDSFVDVTKRVALSVAGHTHAGQVRFPIIGAVAAVIPSKFGKRFHYGQVQEEGKDLVVSGGLGTTKLPIRFLAPPEIVLVNLSSEKNETF